MTELKAPKLRTFYIKNEDDESVVLTLRMARTPIGFQLYCKSKEFHDFFKALSKDTVSEFNKGWGVTMDSYNIGRLWTDRMFDDLRSAVNYKKPDDYVPKTLEVAFRNWNANILLDSPNLQLETTSDTTAWNGTPNISYILSNILDEGVMISFSSPVSNRMFDAVFYATQRYLVWLNDNFLSQRTQGFKLKQKSKDIVKSKDMFGKMDDEKNTWTTYGKYMEPDHDDQGDLEI
jgi:hypothetical protein|tara:strand:+ start:8282 stop:8980 length:699 start_codon:yes stop_codon:yes gene_type:complete